MRFQWLVAGGGRVGLSCVSCGRRGRDVVAVRAVSCCAIKECREGRRKKEEVMVVPEIDVQKQKRRKKRI